MGRYFTSAELAGFCDVDTKTIHNWCDQGKGPPFFKTPGRHLRFEPAKVAEWLRDRGWPVPAQVTAALPALDAPAASGPATGERGAA